MQTMEQMDQSGVEIIERKTAFKGHFSLDVFRLRHRLFDGGWTPVIEREVFRRGHAAAVLLYDADADAVVLVEQFRSGAMAAGLDAWLLEPVAGGVKPNESAEEMAIRECREEAGCEPQELIRIASYLPSPGGDSEVVTLFCGKVDSRGVGGTYGVKDEHEDIRVHIVPADLAIARLDQDVYWNGVLIMALQWLALHRTELRARWATQA